MKTYNSTELLKQELLDELYNEGGEYTYTYTCKYNKKRFVPFWIVKNKYGINTIVFNTNGRKYEQEHFWYNQLSSKVLCKYVSMKK